MKQWLAKIAFFMVLLLFLIPGRYEIAHVSDMYRHHPWLVVLLIGLLVAGFGWWLRGQAELKIKDPLRR
jgi:hypothetical protein